MSEVTQMLEAAQEGDGDAMEKLFTLLYDELRRIAAGKLAQERPGQTLQATALVHEVWLRLAGSDQKIKFKNRQHFFATASKAMRRILVDRARCRQVREKNGYAEREELTDSMIAAPIRDEELLAVDEVLDELASEDPAAAELVELRYFVGLSIPEAAEVMGLSQRSTERLWTFACAWLRRALKRKASQ